MKGSDGLSKDNTLGKMISDDIRKHDSLAVFGRGMKRPTLLFLSVSPES